MDINPKVPQKSSIFSKNPYPATGFSDSIIASQNKPEISRIKANFDRNCQNIPNFAARTWLSAAQKTQKNQKTTEIKSHCGFTLCN